MSGSEFTGISKESTSGDSHLAVMGFHTVFIKEEQMSEDEVEHEGYSVSIKKEVEGNNDGLLSLTIKNEETSEERDCDGNILNENNLSPQSQRHVLDGSRYLSSCSDEMNNSSNIVVVKNEFMCNCCNEVFMSHSLLNEHLSSHFGENPYVCHDCQKPLSHFGNLKTHLSNQNRSYCDQCEKSFNHTGRLKTCNFTHTENITMEECQRDDFNHSVDHKRKMGVERMEDIESDLTSEFLKTECDEEKVSKNLLKNKSKTERAKELSRQRSQRYRERKKAATSYDDNKEQKERDRELARRRVQRYRENKLKSNSKDTERSLTPESNDETERAKELARRRVQRYREKKKATISYNENKEQIERDRELARQRSQRYRENKRVANLLNKNIYTVHETQIPGSSKRVNIPLEASVISNISNEPKKTGDEYTQNIDCLLTKGEEDYVVHVASEDNDISQMESDNRIEHFKQTISALQPQVFKEANAGSDILNRESQQSFRPRQSHYPRIYSSFNRNSSAHRQFQKQFVENDFGHGCDICDRLWFKNDLKSVMNDDETSNIQFIRTILPNNATQEIKICVTCSIAIQKQNIPPLSVYNGFKYSPVPDNLKACRLDFVTERLISPRIPFMQIRRLRHAQSQHDIFGQVINGPVKVNTMVNRLPRSVDDDHCVTVHIKRKKIHKSGYVYRLVNKRTIKEWLQYLIKTPLYMMHNITTDENFFSDEVGIDNAPVYGDSGVSEDIPVNESLVAQQKTLVWNDDWYLKIAMGERKIPISLLFDDHAEELSFPQIYLGHVRKFREGVRVTPFMMATSEIRRSDRRGVTPHHLLYMAMKIMRIRVRDYLKIALKYVSKDTLIIKEQIQSEDNIQGCIESNLAFLRSIPNSTWYWSERKKDLFAMIRQLGKPTVFFTISANETGWPELLQLLYKLKNNKEIALEVAAALHYIEKSTLINEDAVTCAIYFNKLVSVVLKILQSQRYSPFNKYRIVHYFEIIEFQHQGSPHAHVLAWLDNAPKDALHEDYDKAIELIDALISVSASEASGNIKLQTHKHNINCYKKIRSKKAQKCKFEAPFMPSKKTMILTPMKETQSGFTTYKKRFTEIRTNLENEDYTDFDEFYMRNNITTDEEYIHIIRAGINRPKVFVKRYPSEKWHHPFNPFLLNVVKSYTDFQFIAEEFSCAACVVKYVNKTNRGISDLQRRVIETMTEHPQFNISEFNKDISDNILNNTEITSQEAAWYLLREPMSKTSTFIVYIPTVWPVERLKIKKTMRELSEMEDDSSDVWKENWFDKYEKRPDHLDNVSLAQFVSKYKKNNKGEYVERDEPKVIRYRNYDMVKDFNDYKREMVTLHIPFRNEEMEILADMKFITKYEENEELILQRRQEFESDMDIGKTIEICRGLRCEENQSDDDEVQDTAKNPFEQFYSSPKFFFEDLYRWI